MRCKSSAFQPFQSANQIVSKAAYNSKPETEVRDYPLPKEVRELIGKLPSVLRRSANALKSLTMPSGLAVAK